MTARILSGALIAGLAAGLLAALLNIWTLTPLILAAESFEGAAPATHAHDDGVAHSHAPADTPPAGAAAGAAAELHAGPASPGRMLGTVATTLVAYGGFALVMGAGMALARRAGQPLDARRGLLWGLAGFAAVHLAPAAGLPPELPGIDSAPLAARQAWWALCVAASATGLAVLAFGRGGAWVALGVALLLLPHAVGAPRPPSWDGTVPPGLAAAFATRSLAVAALSWAALGALAGALAQRQRVPLPA